jgi:hypothetical protein
MDLMTIGVLYPSAGTGFAERGSCCDTVEPQILYHEKGLDANPWGRNSASYVCGVGEGWEEAPPLKL